MSITPPTGILDITNATVRVSKLEFRESTGFDTILNNVARNTVLLVDQNVEYTSSNSWALKLPNAWVAEFDAYWASGASGNIDFNVYNNLTSGTNGYTISMDDTTITVAYDGGSALATATLGSTLKNDTWRKIHVLFERDMISVALDGVPVLYFKDTLLRPRVYDENSGYVVVSGLSADRKFKNIRVVNGDKWITDGTSNIAYVHGNVGIGTKTPEYTLDVKGDVRATGNLLIEGLTTTVDTQNLSIEDAIVEIGRGNDGGTSGKDVGFLFTRNNGADTTNSNVALIYDESTDRLTFGYSDGSPTDSTLAINTSKSLDVVIPSGNVGIGTTDPGDKKLKTWNGDISASTTPVSFGSRVLGSGSSHMSRLEVREIPETSPVTWEDWSTRIQKRIDTTYQGYIEFNPPGGDYGLAFGNSGGGTPGEHMRILQNGNVGIGTTSPDAKLDVVTSSTKPALWLRNSTNASGCVINMTDTTNSVQYGTLTYVHSNGSSLGAQNALHFTTSESSSVFSVEGTLMIGVDGKDNGQMLSNGNAGRRNLWIQSTFNGNTSQNYGWWIGAQNGTLSSSDNDLYFAVVRNGSIKNAGTINDQYEASMNNFTGQHRSFVKGVPTQQLEDKEGLIVSADQNDFIRMSGGIARGNEAITTNESLPVVSFSTKSNDKKCFGVVSTTEDPENRVEVYGNFKSNMHKELGDTRVYINSVGEGAIWVTNINGSLESGDYITTSNVAGYGMRQDDDILHNYTVAKITMDCDFNPRTQPKKIIKKELANVDYWIDYATSEIKQEKYETLPENEREIREDKYYKIYKREIQKTNPEKDKFVHEVHEELVNVLDEHGQLQWEDDPSGATEKAYKIRYLDAAGQQTDEANAVHIAAFVGCTYHCG